jgi:hypothetical protein
VLATNRHALKEWSVVCDRLVQGKQILVIRKGGIREVRKGFAVEHREFYLFATHFHQREEELNPEAREALRPPPEPGQIDLPGYAELVDDIHVTELERLRGLEGMHALTWAEVEHRFHYGKTKGVHVLVLRVHPLRVSTRIPNRPEYDGCVSWVDLGTELPVDTLGPVFNRTDFRQRLESIQAALGA